MGNCGGCLKPKLNEPERTAQGEGRLTQSSEFLSQQQQPLFSKQQQTKFGANRKQVQKKKAPVADNRVHLKTDTDAPTAIKTEREKTKRDIQQIRRALNNHFLFNNLPTQNLQLVIDQMKNYVLGPKEVVFTQGQPGNNFFIIQTGKVQIIVNNHHKGYISKGFGFGQLALLHDSQRTATIRTVEKVSLWGIDRQNFRHAVQLISSNKYEQNKRFLQSVPLFRVLTVEQKDGLLAVLTIQQYTDGQKIVIEGDPGDLFYIIKEGTVSCSRRAMELRQMNSGEFFGEQALLYNTERTATVTSLGNTSLLSIGREALVKVLGDRLQQIIYKNSQRIAMEKSEVLNSLNKFQMDSLIDRMAVQSYFPTQKVIPAGTLTGTKLWVVLKGELKTQNRTIGVFNCIGDKELLEAPGLDVFEEDIVASYDSDVAEITRQEIQIAIGGPIGNIQSKNEVIQVLKRVQLLRSLPRVTIERLVTGLRVQLYQDQAIIFEQNEPGNSFYIVKEGQVQILKDGIKIRTIVKNDYFGQRSILKNENRTATVRAQGPASCWILSRQDFLSLVDEGIRAQLLKRMDLQNDTVALPDLKMVKILGKGMFGNVFLTVHSTSTILYALKTVERKKIAAYDIYQNLILQRQILLQLDHPLIMKLVKTFKDQKRIYFLMEYVRGMDLFDVLRAMNLLNNEQSRFYAACLILIMEHLHEQRIIYRDLKPENIMVDDEGYPKLIDFGTAKIIEGRTYTVVGTPHYMAPQVITGKGYSLSADYWSIGIIIYEFICGCVPFGEEEEDPFRIYEKVLEHRLAYPNYINPNFKAKPFIEQLLSKNSAMRGNYDSIKEHSWFLGLDWERVLGKQLKPPYIPKLNSMQIEVSNAMKKTQTLLELIDREEIKDALEIPRSKGNPEPPGWDEGF